MRLPEPALLVITDRRQARVSLENIARAVFAAGCRWLSLREKDLDATARRGLLERLASEGARWGAIVSVHDDVEAACAVQGTALHLPATASVAAARSRLGPGRLIGRSAHRGDVLSDPGVSGLDYVTLSPVHSTASKPGYGPALGVDGLARAVRGAETPVIALGGIRPGDVRTCLDAGAAGVAAMGEVMRADQPARVVEAFLAGFAG